MGTAMTTARLDVDAQSAPTSFAPRKWTITILVGLAIVAAMCFASIAAPDTTNSALNRLKNVVGAGQKTYDMGFPLRTPSGDDAPASQLYRTKITYTTGEPRGHMKGKGVCTSSQVNKLRASVNAFKVPMKKALGNSFTPWKSRNTKYWNLFFGSSTSSKTDTDVSGILADAGRAFENFGTSWMAECCPTSVYSTSPCATCITHPGTLAFALSYTQGSTKHSYRKIRFCPNTFNEKDMTLGLTIYHELIHMVSGVKDVVGYDKTLIQNAAKSNPENARLNANNYALYVAKSGLEHRKYDEATKGWGRSLEDRNCYDGYSNCVSLARQGACNQAHIKSGCCEACKPGGSNRL